MRAADPCGELVALAEQEHALVAGGRIDDLPALHRRRQELLDALPAELAPEDRVRLEHAYAVQAQVLEHLARARDEVAAELSRVDHGRTALAAYSRSIG